LQLLADQCRGQTVVVVLGNAGSKYLSTDLWK
jgi:hypothetical protein